MANNYEIGMVVEGTVVQIKPFGAFIQLDEKTKGLVHISQVSHDYINNITDVINEGDNVKVKIISIEPETKKIALSIKGTQDKKTFEKPAFTSKRENFIKNETFNKNDDRSSSEKAPLTLEEMLKDFTRQSNDRFSDLNKRQKRN
ncbi:MAG: S1 RNA-binding domain-containing protein [Filifactoraceae bacterium]